jgi:hypothetical protein
MRSRASRFAHVLERSGLALAGAACGLFVAAHVGSSIALFTSLGFVFIMMIAGAAGFYFGIDTPPHRSDAAEGKVDTAELLSAVGTFLATLTAFASVSVIMFRQEPALFWTAIIMLGWTIGVIMQIVAGAIARHRA